jgi:phage gp29-like protein
MEKMLAPLMAKLKDGARPDVLLAELAGLYPQLDARDMEELLARAIFVSDVWGRLSARDEGDGQG